MLCHVALGAKVWMWCRIKKNKQKGEQVAERERDNERNSASSTGPSDLERETTKKRVEAEALAILKTEAARKDREDLERKRAREIRIMEWVSTKEA